MKSFCVLSDLHMYCRRSRWEELIPEIRDAASQSDLFVFNGDTFDFKWSCLPSLDETVLAAEAFLRELALDCPRCRVHVNLGNHDHQPLFMQALDRLANELDNFTWDPYFLRVEDTLFLHGDVALKRMKHADLERYREHWRGHRRQGELRNRLYDAAFRVNLHAILPRILFRRRRTARCVRAYLEDIGHSSRQGVRRVYFGHTHVLLEGYHYRGLTFHNGGAPLDGLHFSLIRAEG